MIDQDYKRSRKQLKISQHKKRNVNKKENCKKERKKGIGWKVKRYRGNISLEDLIPTRVFSSASLFFPLSFLPAKREWVQRNKERGRNQLAPLIKMGWTKTKMLRKCTILAQFFSSSLPELSSHRIDVLLTLWSRKKQNVRVSSFLSVNKRDR